tara:strand:+ start:162 stop:467 length:306 start_codon:yes stop_codon:yes gene_type:complete
MSNSQEKFYTIRGYDRLLDENYVKMVPASKNEIGLRTPEHEMIFFCRDEAWRNCRFSESVVTWHFSHEIKYMDNSSELIYTDPHTGEKRERSGMFAHGDLC